MKTTKYGVFYKSNGRWIPMRTNVTRQPRTFTTTRGLNRFLNSTNTKIERNYYLKSRLLVRKLSK